MMFTNLAALGEAPAMSNLAAALIVFFCLVYIALRRA
jgi:hypothetical protein